MDAYHLATIKLIVLNDLPICLVETYRFCHLVDILHPNAPAMTHQTVARIVAREFRLEEAGVLQELAVSVQLSGDLHSF